MNELELIRDACATVREPHDDAIAAAREALRREIREFEAQSAPARRGRPWRALAVGAGIAVALGGFLTLVVSSRQSPLGVRVAAAADEALSPTNGDIVHEVTRTTVTFHAGGRTTSSTSAVETWLASRSPLARLDQYGTGPLDSETILTTSCGQISYDPGANLFTVSTYSVAAQILRSTPVSLFHDARRHGHVHFSGATTFHGIPAFKLIVTQYGSETTYIVRRVNGYPLEIVERRVTASDTQTSVTTYAVFEHLQRTPRTARLLRITPHPGAFFLRLPRATRQASCKRFGSLESLTKRSNRP